MPQSSSLIVRLRVVLWRRAFSSNDWRFDNLSSYHQSWLRWWLLLRMLHGVTSPKLRRFVRYCNEDYLPLVIRFKSLRAWKLWEYLQLCNLGLFNDYVASIFLLNAFKPSSNCYNRYGWTEVVVALMDNQNVKIVNLGNSQGKTALHYACSEGHDRAVETLLRLGAVVEK